MAFQRPHPRQRRTYEEYKAELEEENYHLRSELQTEVDFNHQNESRINQLERDYSRCEQEIQVLNREIERLENASEEEIAELKSEISSLKNKLCQAKKDVRDKEKYISTLENRLVESEEQLANAIDSFVDNQTTARAIMADQVKRATRQIRRKETTLQQDLIREQKRRYDAEAERDNEIIRRQLAEGGMDRIVGDLQQL
ncbi:hypothetical protein GLOIN_2v1778046 [Rhizophagus clarus]|uniref:Uncharacterized protein n=1 Tax=Rhizophagus clarus TaxID=94130 RepID=A0A8H3LBB2_9GLOM|nr:hypothetical protein GLOIN_2v1778046 [Rhizophagus clarus]